MPASSSKFTSIYSICANYRLYLPQEIDLRILKENITFTNQQRLLTEARFTVPGDTGRNFPMGYKLSFIFVVWKSIP